MKRLVDQDHPSGTVEQQAAELLASVGPTRVDPGLKQRVRRELLRSPPTRTAAWMPRGLRLPIIAAVLGFTAVSAAGAAWFVRSRVPVEHVDVSQPESPQPPKPALKPAPKPVPQRTDVAPVVTPLVEPSTPPPPTATQASAPPKPKPPEKPDPVTEAGMLFDATRALRHEGNAQKARRILSEYRRQFPGGAMSEEALALSIEIAQRSGDPRAKQLAKRYLERYPSGHFRSRAERALEAAP